MSRWEPAAAQRLERAALELFADQGFSATTVPQIAARAGLTTRSFFRHFADKREALFFHQREFPDLVAGLIAGAPATLAPMDLIMFGLEAVAADRFDPRRDELALRRTVIHSEQELRERELLKQSALSDTIHTALLAHHVDAVEASLLAPIAVMLLDVSLGHWLEGSTTRSLTEVLRDTRSTMGQLVR